MRNTAGFWRRKKTTIASLFLCPIFHALQRSAVPKHASGAESVFCRWVSSQAVVANCDACSPLRPYHLRIRRKIRSRAARQSLRETRAITTMFPQSVLVTTDAFPYIKTGGKRAEGPATKQRGESARVNWL